MEESPSLHIVVVAIEKEAFRSPSTKVANYAYYTPFDKFGEFCLRSLP